MVLSVEEKSARAAERKRRHAESVERGREFQAAQQRRYADERGRQQALDECYKSGKPEVVLTLHVGQVLLMLDAIRNGISLMDNGIPTDEQLDASKFVHAPGYREHCRFARVNVERVRQLHGDILSSLRQQFE